MRPLTNRIPGPARKRRRPSRQHPRRRLASADSGCFFAKRDAVMLLGWGTCNQSDPRAISLIWDLSFTVPIRSFNAVDGRRPALDGVSAESDLKQLAKKPRDALYFSLI